MNICLLGCVLFLMFVVESLSELKEECPNVKTDFRALRRKRYLHFPDKSNVVLTISLVKALMTHAPAGWNIALEIDVPFPLPDANFTNHVARKKLHHRQKRDFWDRLSSAIEFHNMNGRACIVRSICEARTSLAPPGNSLVHDILRAVFTVPLYEEHNISESTEDTEQAYNELRDPELCRNVEDCPFSLLNFVMEFNKPTTTYL